jgi:hypothetical protein
VVTEHKAKIVETDKFSTKRLTMSASAIPVPLSRRTSFVERHGEIISDMTQKSAERHLAHQLKVQREALGRRGVAADRIEREIASLQRAIISASLEFVA